MRLIGRLVNVGSAAAANQVSQMRPIGRPSSFFLGDGLFPDVSHEMRLSGRRTLIVTAQQMRLKGR